MRHGGKSVLIKRQNRQRIISFNPRNDSTQQFQHESKFHKSGSNLGLMGLLGITSTLRIYNSENFSLMCRNSSLALQKILILTILPKSPDLVGESVSCSVISDSLWPHGLCSPPGSSVHVIFQARILEWVAISYSRGSAWPRDWSWVSCTAGIFFTIYLVKQTFSYLSKPYKCTLKKLQSLFILTENKEILTCDFSLRESLDINSPWSWLFLFL